MQPAPNSAPISPKSSKTRLPGFVIAILVFGVLKGWPLIFAQAQQMVAPPPATAQAVVQQVASSAEPKKAVSFEEKYKDWSVLIPRYEIRVTVRADWSYETYVHRKILVQTKDGKDAGENPIYYDGDTEEIRVIKAATITPDGKEHPPVKVQDFSIYGDGMYSGAKKKILSMPEVTPGSVIDLEYVKTTKRLPMANAFWYIQYAEGAIPIKEQKIIFRFPKSAGIMFKSFLESWKPDIKEMNGDMVYTWERQDYEPDTDPEEGMLPLPTVETVGDGLEFSSVKSWQDVAVWYYGLIQKNLKITPEITGAAQAATKGKKSVREKTRAILEYLQENFRYVSMSFGNYSMEPHPTEEVFRNKYGDCKDQSLLAKAMLRVVGVEADLSAFTMEGEGNDPREDLPLLNFYEHVLLKVYDPEKGDFYADPLLKGYDVGEYPVSYEGGYTLVFTSGGGKFETIPVWEDRLEEASTHLIEIRPDGSAVDRTEHEWGLTDSISTRQKINSMNGEEREKYFESVRDEIAGGGKALEMNVEGLETKYGPMRVKSITDRPDDFPVKEGLIVIDLPSFDSPDGWSAKERKNPIFCPVNLSSRRSLTFKVPAGFEIMHLPKGYELDNGFFSTKCTIERKEDTIKIKMQKRYRRIELPASEYPRLKEFFVKLPSRTEQRIILKKKDGTT